MSERHSTPNRKEIADAIRRATEIYRANGVTGTIGTADVLQMLRSQGKTDEANELERLLALIKARRAPSSTPE